MVTWWCCNDDGQSPLSGEHYGGSKSIFKLVSFVFFNLMMMMMMMMKEMHMNIKMNINMNMNMNMKMKMKTVFRFIDFGSWTKGRRLWRAKLPKATVFSKSQFHKACRR